MKYKEGDIVASKIRFISTDEVSKRILLIVKVNDNSYDCCCLTTNFRNLPWQVGIYPNEWNRLDQTSYVQLHEMYELDDSIIFKKYGDLDNPHINAWKQEWQDIHFEESHIKRIQRFLSKIEPIMQIKKQPIENMSDLCFNNKRSKRKCM